MKPHHSPRYATCRRYAVALLLTALLLASAAHLYAVAIRPL